MRNWYISLTRLAPRPHSLVSICSVYGTDGFKVLNTYLTGTPSMIKIGDSDLPVTKENVDRVISLANLIIELGLPRLATFNLRIENEMLKLNVASAIREEFEFRRFISVALFRYYLEKFRKKGGVVKNVSGTNLIQGELDGLFWFFRRYSYQDIYAGALAHCEEEPYEFDWVMKILARSAKPVFIDVGAYVGGYTIRASRLGAVTISLEPDPSNYEILRKNLEANSCANSLALNIAAGSSTRKLPLYGEDFDSTVSSIKYGRKLRGYIDVKPLDEVLKDTVLLSTGNEIDVLKIDVEGAEIDVLKGANKTLANSRYLLLEIWDKNLHYVYKMLKAMRFRPVAEVRYMKGIKYRNVLFRNLNIS